MNWLCYRCWPVLQSWASSEALGFFLCALCYLKGNYNMSTEGPSCQDCHLLHIVFFRKLNIAQLSVLYATHMCHLKASCSRSVHLNSDFTHLVQSPNPQWNKLKSSLWFFFFKVKFLLDCSEENYPDFLHKEARKRSVSLDWKLGEGRRTR